MNVFRVTCCTLLAACCTLPLYAVDYPKPAGFVVDAANIIDEATQQQLEKQLSDFEKQTTIEIAVATVPSLHGEVIETYAVKLFETWGIGKKDKDNGVLLLVAPIERKVRIEVGYGLESKLTDGQCGEIVRSVILPAFEQGNYSAGISYGIISLQRVISDPSLVAEVSAPSDSSNYWPLLLTLALFFLPFGFFTPISILLTVCALHWGVGFWRFSGILFIPLGIFIDALRFGKTRKRFANSWIDSLSGGGYGRGGFGGGGGGFGGFGGGSSGGGGASGSW